MGVPAAGVKILDPGWESLRKALEASLRRALGGLNDSLVERKLGPLNPSPIAELVRELDHPEPPRARPQGPRRQDDEWLDDHGAARPMEGPPPIQHCD